MLFNVGKSCDRFLFPLVDDAINGQNSHSMLKEFFVPELKRLDKASSGIFQQDGAPARFSRDIRQYLDKVFPSRWIGSGSPIRWAPSSAELFLLDFFL